MRHMFELMEPEIRDWLAQPSGTGRVRDYEPEDELTEEERERYLENLDGDEFACFTCN